MEAPPARPLARKRPRLDRSPAQRTEKSRTPGRRKLEIRNSAIIELLYATGMRVSELCTLRVNGLSFDETTVRVTGKGEKTRIIPVGRAALDAITNI